MLPGFVGGCGMSQGQLFYMLGFGRGKKIEAEFRLTTGPVLILLDDPTGAIGQPAARQYLVDELGQLLVKKKAAQKIIPRRTLEQVRQSHPDFETRGAREVGGVEDIGGIR